jgi:hypothetical protein
MKGTNMGAEEIGKPSSKTTKQLLAGKKKLKEIEYKVGRGKG